MEIRSAPIQLRQTAANEAVIEAVIIRYGDVATIQTAAGEFRESFRPGSIRRDGTVFLNVLHDDGARIASERDGDGLGALEVEDDAVSLRMRATLDLGVDRARQTVGAVEAGFLAGASIEFAPRRVTREPSGVRLVRDSTLVGAALVHRPAYSQTSAAVARRWARSSSPRLGSGDRRRLLILEGLV